MDRRTLIGAFAAGAALPLLNQVASSQPSPKTKNVVFVHGLFADGSSWSKSFRDCSKRASTDLRAKSPDDAA